ncbi:glycosyltransferase family 8 protein [bacterium]|nr:glycosyltransferase family 8 protein [bacterium]
MSIKPKWNENFTAIAMSSSKEYVPYLSVCLQSLKENTSKKHNYDIIIFEQKIPEKDKKILKKQIEQKNISLRFVNPAKFLSGYQFEFRNNWALECYFRLTAPVVLNEYRKIIFTDIDIAFKKDIQDLYKIEAPNGIAACLEINYPPFYLQNKEIKKHLHEELKLDSPYQYYNTGVLVINLEYFRQNNLTKKLLDISSEKTYRYLEQDVLNMYFKNKITRLDEKWNSLAPSLLRGEIVKKIDKNELKRYYKGREEACIIHYIGGKPWEITNADRSDVWWKYANKTPYTKNKKKEIVKRRILLILKQVL